MVGKYTRVIRVKWNEFTCNDVNEGDLKKPTKPNSRLRAQMEVRGVPPKKTTAPIPEITSTRKEWPEMNIQTPANQHTFQQRNLAKQNQNSKSPSSEQAMKPIGLLQSQQTNEPAIMSAKGPAARAKPQNNLCARLVLGSPEIWPRVVNAKISIPTSPLL